MPSQEVGLAILGPLRQLDEVAYLRFASVYRGFESLADFEAEISSLRAAREAARGAARGSASKRQEGEDDATAHGYDGDWPTDRELVAGGGASNGGTSNGSATNGRATIDHST